MTIGPLDQLYLETASKEDLLAEINDQRRQVIESRCLASELERKLRESQKELDAANSENKSLSARLISANNRLAKMYKKHGKPKNASGAIKNKILNLIICGFENKAIAEKGFNPSTVRAIRSKIGSAKKKALSQSE